MRAREVGHHGGVLRRGPGASRALGWGIRTEGQAEELLLFLEQIMRLRPTPVLMVSSLTDEGADVTLRALELGAVDFVTKPSIDIARGLEDKRSELIAKVKAAACSQPRALTLAASPPVPTPGRTALELLLPPMAWLWLNVLPTTVRLAAF